MTGVSGSPSRRIRNRFSRVSPSTATRTGTTACAYSIVYFSIFFFLASYLRLLKFSAASAPCAATIQAREGLFVSPTFMPRGEGWREAQVFTPSAEYPAASDAAGMNPRRKSISNRGKANLLIKRRRGPPYPPGGGTL